MPYRLDLTQRLDAEFTRISVEQIDCAICLLEKFKRPAHAVHETRKHMKKLRALLRSVRSGLPEDYYRSQNARYRDTARVMSQARDIQVMGETLNHLVERRKRIAQTVTYEIFRKWLRSHSGTQAKKVDIETRQKLVQELQAARAEVKEVKLTETGLDPFFLGVEKAYRFAQKAYEAAQHPDVATQPESANPLFHEFRKGVQAHWRQMQLLSRVWPEEISLRITQTKRLSDQLGLDHDIAVMAEFIKGGSWIPAPGKSRRRKINQSSFLRQLYKVQEKLRAEADINARLLFAERPKHLRRRMEAYAAVAMKT